MGLIGGVKSWMEGSKRKNLSDSRAQSPSGVQSPTHDDDSSESSQGEESDRGRKMEKTDGLANLAPEHMETGV